MPELRKDPITGRWVIISTERGKRPSDFVRESVEIKGKGICPFCPGNEGKTPPEILAYGRNGTGRDTPGWTVRVVPNKFPALGIEGGLDREGEGLFDRMNGVGAHEVIVETPDHNLTMATMSDRAVEEVLWAYRDRVVDLKNDRRFRYVLLFKNHGEPAGASLEHTHSQLIALPIVPKRVREEVDNSKRYYDEKERCIFCDMIRQEIETEKRVILETISSSPSLRMRRDFRSRLGYCRGGIAPLSKICPARFMAASLVCSANFSGASIQFYRSLPTITSCIPRPSAKR